MDIGRTDGVGGTNPIERTPRISIPAPSSSVPGAGFVDRVELSQQSQLISEALGLPPVRAERIDEVRQLLASGELDSDTRLEGAMDRFLSENSDLLPE